MQRSLDNGIKLEITRSRITTKSLKLWKSISTLLNKPLVKEEFTKEIRRYFKLNDNLRYQNLCNAANTAFKGKF